MCIGVSTPLLQKYHLIFFAKAPLNQQIVQALFLGNLPLYIDFSWTPP